MAGIENNSIDMVNAVLATGGLNAETLTSALARATQGNKTEIVEALKKAGATPAKEPDFKIDPAVMQNYVGRYKNDEIGMEMTFTAQNDKLVGSIPGQPALTYAPVDTNNFKAAEFSGIDITFNSTGNQVAGFTLKQGGRSFVFKKVKAGEKTAEPKSAEVEKKETKTETAIATTSNAKKNGFAAAKNWPSFRGMFASGVADGQNPPTSLNAGKSFNIKWKTPIPGMAHSSPVIWGNRVFITTAISSDTSSRLRVGLYGDVAPDKDLSWGTPTIHEGESRAELITNGSKHIRGYDPMTGKELWKLAGNSEITAPTPFVAHDLILADCGGWHAVLYQ